MYIKDVCRECKLTKKAVEYYEQQGLIFPKREDNGYRNYSDEDVSTLKEIGVLRKLGVSIDDIKNILTSSNKASALEKIKYKMDLQIEKSMAKKKCLEQLMKNYNIEYAIKYIEKNIEKNFTIKEKLLQAFPGSYGMFLCVHFGKFLNDRIDTEEKEEAYNKIVDYLDRVQHMEFPKELEEYLTCAFEQMEQTDVQKMDEAIMDVINDVDAYIKEHKEDIETYLKYRMSNEFKKSPMYKVQQLLLQFQQASGYSDIFIENLKILSDSYRQYLEKLHAANKVFIEKYPEANNIYEL